MSWEVDQLKNNPWTVARNEAPAPAKVHKIEMKPMKSTNISYGGYSKEHATLFILFRNTPETVYAYSEVESATADAFFRAPSAGRFFHSQIEGEHEFKKLPSNKETATLSGAGLLEVCTHAPGQDMCPVCLPF